MVGRLVDIFVPLAEEESVALARVARQAGLAVVDARVVRRSLDARKGHPIGFHLQIALGVVEAPAGLPPPVQARRGSRVLCIGAGPAGTFAASRLAAAGVAVTLVDGGKPVQPRRHDLATLTQRGELDPDSNYCFGEGGAGTFSDGKLYTRTKDKAGVRAVLDELVAHGADPGILVDSRPHIGSNLLPKLLTAMRLRLEAAGVVYRWGDMVSELVVADGRVIGVRTRSGAELLANAVVLAVGHSARPLYEQLHRQAVALEAKPFAVGVRVEHPQPLIDRLQYGQAFQHPRLEAAFYHVTATVGTSAGDRGAYSFCMCPGGWVVNSATEAGRLCTNGMSLKRRDSPFANAALVVSVEPRDFASLGPLAGMQFQRLLEERAFAAGGGEFVAAAQRVPDFLASRPSTEIGKSSYRPSVVPGDVRGALPVFVAEALSGALQRWDKVLPGFASSEAQLVGVETRTSSPLRILRSEASLQSPSHPGLFPSAEGAGYAGGIVSAALDGYRVADAVLVGLS